ncbi:DEAD/DEAH box helicase [Alkalihalophilus lindianensis]|uniref:ATP-dependent RNA helicase DbpA n=1 Tax=Alkalihalophilus lindianensis TaxID=1630542 RepID=A0ABU3X754_9BACI|nr:DEAD/DEAH box helicase [Alkalihalophilus lindianensis]MDV2683638.1 DEAD/DEAH box helicase [Alkalihalophilus lindianensis]
MYKDLSQEIKQALQLLNYVKPTDVQREVLPVALKHNDLIVKAQTGSGKTAAFAIPLCELVEWEENKPQALVLTPTRELAAQVKDEITNIGRFKRIKAAAIYGKQSYEKQKIELKQKNHVVVGTPGRVYDHIQKGTLATSQIRYLVIDEADEMLNMGFIDQVEDIIETLPKERMTMLFSATFPTDLEELSNEHMNNPTNIVIHPSNQTAKISHTVIEAEKEGKYQLLKDVLITENPDSCIIFCQTQLQVDQLQQQLSKATIPARKLHGGMRQEDRFRVMNDFKRGAFRYLVATGVAGRGIDVENISLVINFDTPEEKESYVHRTGRTGRAGKTGKAITFVAPFEEKFIEEIEEFVGHTLVRVSPPTKKDVQQATNAYHLKLNKDPVLKTDKAKELNQTIMKLYFNGGKKKKIRAVDFVGTISSIDGIQADDIGIITIQENSTYVEILNGKGPFVLREMRERTVKGKQLKVHEAKK